MTTMTQIWLILHVFFGLAGTLFYGAAWLGIERRDIITGKLHHYTLNGLLSIILAWITGSLYYTGFYGTMVKPVILAGKYPWAHQFVTELKEHIFLFMPFLALAATLTVWLMGERLHNHPKLKGNTAMLVGVVVTIGSLMALMGVVISGAVR